MSYDRETQGVLFSGLDCLPGQRDLFETDGQPEGDVDQTDTTNQPQTEEN